MLNLVESLVNDVEQDVEDQPSGVVKPAVRKWLDHFQGLLKKANVPLCKSVMQLGVSGSQIVPGYRLSSKILVVTERIGNACEWTTLATLNVVFSLDSRMHSRVESLENLCRELKKERGLENVGIITRKVS